MKKRLFFLSTVMLILFMLIACSTQDNPTVYSIGDIGPSGVGIVFYVIDGGLHGMEAAPSGWGGGSDDPAVEWIIGGSTQTTANGNTSPNFGEGLANSNAILAQTDHTGSAAQLCRDYNGGGHTDWFLPSKDELSQLYLQFSAVGGSFGEPRYWSSSENDANNAWGRDFSDGSENFYGKGNPRSVRAVRTF